MKQFRFHQALKLIWDAIHQLDRYIDRQKPWLLAKPETENRLNQVLSQLEINLKKLAETFEPFLPTTAETIKQALANHKPQALFPRL